MSKTLEQLKKELDAAVYVAANAAHAAAIAAHAAARETCAAVEDAYAVYSKKLKELEDD